MTSTSARHIVFDVETTGLNPHRGDRIIEIAAVVVQENIITDEFSTLVNSGQHIPKTVQSINGITNEMLMHQPTPEEAFFRFIAFTGNDPLVAHNAKFDMKFLRYELSRLGRSLPNRSVCTLEMSRKKYPGLPNHKLETMAEYLLRERSKSFQYHRALDDARLTAMIWLEMNNS